MAINLRARNADEVTRLLTKDDEESHEMAVALLLDYPAFHGMPGLHDLHQFKDYRRMSTVRFLFDNRPAFVEGSEGRDYIARRLCTLFNSLFHALQDKEDLVTDGFGGHNLYIRAVSCQVVESMQDNSPEQGGPLGVETKAYDALLFCSRLIQARKSLMGQNEGD
ncbi:hypothetical protein ACHAQA_009424 [Verticillium albo-atrum]